MIPVLALDSDEQEIDLSSSETYKAIWITAVVAGGIWVLIALWLCYDCYKARRKYQPANTVNGNVTLGSSAARNAARSKTRNTTAQSRSSIFSPSTPTTSSSSGATQNVSDDPPPAYELAEMPAAVIRDGCGRQNKIANMV